MEKENSEAITQKRYFFELFLCISKSNIFCSLGLSTFLQVNALTSIQHLRSIASTTFFFIMIIKNEKILIKKIKLLIFSLRIHCYEFKASSLLIKKC